MRYGLVIILLTLIIDANAAEFHRPWDDLNVPLIIDPYYGNSIDWNKLKTEPRVVAIIHKATIGTNKIDPGYFVRKTEAKNRGYLWGSYHWGLAGNPEKQADYYIDTVKPANDELIALDLEDATSTKLMNADEAIIFIKRVKERTGRYPVLYTNHESAKLISEKYKDTEFANTPLWYARFKTTITDFPSDIWSTYVLWQFSSEIAAQKAVPGTRADMDINVYNGTIDELKANWPLTKVPADKSQNMSASSDPIISTKDDDEDFQWAREFYLRVIPKPNCDKDKNLSFPRWEGFRVEHCDYSDGGVHTKPYLLNPSADKLAHWMVNACRDVAAASVKKCVEHMNGLMRVASSYGYFPVAGYIPEPSDAVDGKTKGVMYCTLFRDGVTIATDTWDTSPSVNDKCGSDDENDVPVKKAKTYARIISTTREEYMAAGGKLPVDGLRWLDTVRQLYQSAWNSDRNMLIFAKTLAEKKRGGF